MDELAGLLESTFQVSNDLYATSGVHPRFSQYKSKNAGPSDQEVRRKRKLEQQKQSRYDFQNHVRQLTSGEFNEDSQSRNLYRGGRGYRDQLMLSEWMVEVPDDFVENWVMVPCPVGKRCLVVASSGQTSSWSKGGWLINKFVSLLPGGRRGEPHWNTESTVLDCIYCELTKTYYVLDMMCWKHQPQYDCETDFRFYWMSTKMSETPELAQITKRNQFRFDVLPNYNCDKGNISNVLHTKMNVQIDGLLFFHKGTHYTLGSTPLVTWLKPYMVPDIIGAEVGAVHMRYKPVTYTSFEAHLLKVKADQEKEEEKDKARKERRKQRRSGNAQCMDTTPSQAVITPAGTEACAEPSSQTCGQSSSQAICESFSQAANGHVIASSDVMDDVLSSPDVIASSDIIGDVLSSPDIIASSDVMCDVLSSSDVIVETEDQLIGDDVSDSAGDVTPDASLGDVSDTQAAGQVYTSSWNPQGNSDPFTQSTPAAADSAALAGKRVGTRKACAAVAGRAAADSSHELSQDEKKVKTKPTKLRAKKVKGRNS